MKKMVGKMRKKILIKIKMNDQFIFSQLIKNRKSKNIQNCLSRHVINSSQISIINVNK